MIETIFENLFKPASRDDIVDRMQETIQELSDAASDVLGYSYKSESPTQYAALLRHRMMMPFLIVVEAGLWVDTYNFYGESTKRVQEKDALEWWAATQELARHIKKKIAEL